MRDIRTLPADRITVSPSVLASDFANLESELRRVTEAGADLIHLDVMDGHLVPNISFGPPVIAMLRKHSELVFDTHLMISRPKQYAAAFAAAGVDHLTFHLESEDDPDETIAEIRRLGMTAGMTIKPATPAEKLLPFLDRIDLVLVMTVEPGFGGQKFMPEMMEKVRILRRAIDASGRKIHLEVDGGIDAVTAPVAKAAGATMFVAGTSVFRAPEGAAAAIAKLKE